MKSRGKTAANEIARVQKLGAKCFSFKVNQRSLTIYSHDDVGTFTNRRIVINALLQRQHSAECDASADHDDVAASVHLDSLDKEVLLLDPVREPEITLSWGESDFTEWSIDACGDSDSDIAFDTGIARTMEDMDEISVTADMLMLSESDFT